MRSARSDKRRMVTLRFPASDRVEVPPGAFKLARERTAHLHRHVEQPVTELLGHAYLQGINDAMQVIERTGWLPPAQREP